MADYATIYNAMVPNVEYTAKDLGVAPASMTAMMRRGLVTISGNTSPRKYIKSTQNPAGWAFMILSTNLSPDIEFFTVHKHNEKYGMLCSFKKNVILDCYDKPYDLTGLSSIEIRHKVFVMED